MTQKPSQPQITSINALIRTIRVDGHVRRWFLYFILHPQLRAEISGNDDIEKVYGKLDLMIHFERIVYGVLFLLLLFAAVIGGRIYILFILSLVGMCVFLQGRKKKLLIAICLEVIQRDFEHSGMAQKSLYQIGELYGARYKICPLLTAMQSVDTVTRKALLYAFLFSTFIFPLNFWYTCGVLIGSYYIFYGLMQTTAVYRRIK